MSENDFAQGFGTNEWIVEDMREAYLADPASVTQSWREFFMGITLSRIGDLPE